MDVKTEINFWKNTLKAKKAYDFSLGNITVGKFLLTKYDLKDIIINKNGVYTSAVISLSLTEYVAPVKSSSKSSTTTSTTTKKAATVKTSTKTSKSQNIVKGSTMAKPKSGTRWYKTAEAAFKKSGTSGKAYQKNMVVYNTYSKNGKIVCVNLDKLGWLRVEDVTISAVSRKD